MKTDPALPDDLELEDGVDAPLSEQERQELEELGALLRVGGQFELDASARARGRAQLEGLLRAQPKAARPGVRTRPQQARPWLWVVVPLAAAILLAWLVPLGRREVPWPAPPPELAAAQSALLTAELTGAPIPRDDWERATRAYRQELLARLEKGR